MSTAPVMVRLTCNDKLFGKAVNRLYRRIRDMQAGTYQRRRAMHAEYRRRCLARTRRRR